tara:strand:- start:454 stop:735 length:282 start_codon:yes stop_codon:yes gene_type:complete
MTLTLFQILEYGPIVAQDEDAGILVTVNGAYFNFYYQVEPGKFACTDHIVHADRGDEQGWVSRTRFYDVVDRAEALLHEFMHPEEEGADDDTE